MACCKTHASLARVQGFSLNFERFAVVCDETSTLLDPFFALDALKTYRMTRWPHEKQSTSVAGTQSQDAPLAKNVDAFETRTTITLCNLPYFFDTVGRVRQFLDIIGYDNECDFAMCIDKPSQTERHYLNFLVNFKSSARATACIAQLHDLHLCANDPALVVTYSAIQGLDACFDECTKETDGIKSAAYFGS
eukprot:TRINITY_DN77483_c0_g1_i1.p1 TRINITY_DN77483_c0_g1~~TRINITY_DN77483_c0_g1_i1.p1  ORF type:complete len:203 (-),score=22.32 TRINITY_DN77483_c0_g1_i1:100-675(-)